MRKVSLADRESQLVVAVVVAVSSRSKQWEQNEQKEEQ